MGHCRTNFAFYLTFLYGVYVPNWQFIVKELKPGSIAIQQSMNKNNCNVSTFCALDPSFTSTINAISSHFQI